MIACRYTDCVNAGPVNRHGECECRVEHVVIGQRGCENYESGKMVCGNCKHYATERCQMAFYMQREDPACENFSKGARR